MDVKDPILQAPFKAYAGDENFLFASYSHKDKIQVYPIIDNLNNMGVKIWYDEGIPIRQSWRKTISEAIDKCKGFLVFLSQNSVESEDVLNEITYALEVNKRSKVEIYPVYLEETALPGELLLAIGRIQALRKFLISENEFYSKLTEVLSPTFSVEKM
jgi:hypothetical protein